MTPRSLLLIPFLALGPYAHAQTELRDALMAAMNAESGQIETILTGPMAEAARAGLQTTDDIVVRISTVSALRQAGCKRMDVLLYIPDKKFPTTDGGSHEFRTGFQLNVCPDGRPPESSHGD